MAVCTLLARVIIFMLRLCSHRDAFDEKKCTLLFISFLLSFIDKICLLPNYCDDDNNE